MTNKSNKISSREAKSNLSFLVVIIIIIGGYILFALTRPMPAITTSAEDITSPSFSGNFNWPSYGESAVGAQGFGLLATHGEQVSKPIASIAKTILALAILKEKPLAKGEPGPSIVMTQNDLNLYNEAVKQNGSNVPVELGENLSEYQILQALLIPSGDNIAETLAIWAFGSQENYLTYANKMVTDWGLDQTHLADASGLSPQTVSSAEDLVTTGEKIMASPVLTEIVNQQEVDLPVVGKVKNYNTLLGQNGIVGIKTGNTDEAGGCLLFSYINQVDSKDTTIIGVILGAPSRYQVLTDTTGFIKSNADNYKYFEIAKKDQVVGIAETPWGKKINVIAKEDFSLLMVPGEKVQVKVSLNSINKSLEKGSEVGNIAVEYNTNTITVPAVLGEKITSPPIWWRLFHPNY